MPSTLRTPFLLLLFTVPAVAASFFILKISLVSGLAAWIQAGAAVAMSVIALVCSRLRQPLTSKWVAGLGMVGILLCALPLLNQAAGPVRWLRIGGFALYIAPLVIPVLLVMAARAAILAPAHAQSPETQRLASASVLMLAALAWVLAIQPDLAQVLALTVAALLIILCLPSPTGSKALLTLAFVLACIWAGLQPDPLEPVPHVEQVIRLAWTHSSWAGLWLSASAALLVMGPAWLLGRRHPAWLAIPAYYAMLLAGSILDMTPAPLMGYGAGPLLGYGLMAGLAAAAVAVDDNLSSR